MICAEKVKVGCDVRIHNAVHMLCHGAAGDALQQSCLEVLITILSNPESVAAVWHPLGCLYIEIFRNAMRSVRIHVWGVREGRCSGSNISVHSHDFYLHSYVITGVIENRIYTKKTGIPTYQLYDIEYYGDVNILRPTGHYLRYEATTCQRVHRGEMYSIPPGQFHSVRVFGDGIVTTFVVADFQPERRGRLLGPIDGRDNVRTKRTPCTVDDLTRVLKNILASTYINAICISDIKHIDYSSVPTF